MKITILGMTLCVMTIMGSFGGLEGGRGEGGFGTDYLCQFYTGNIATTASGRTCQRWDMQHPHPHGNNNPADFPDASLSDAANYCRNVDGSAGAWCYTTDVDQIWEYCSVPGCPL